MKRLLFLLLFVATIAKADIIPVCKFCPTPVSGPGSDWSVKFSVTDGPETFVGDLTVQYATLLGSTGFIQLWSGTITPSGPIDFLPATFSDFSQFLYLAVGGPQGPASVDFLRDEIDFFTSNPYPTVQKTLAPPIVYGASVYSCITQACADAYNNGVIQPGGLEISSPPITNETVRDISVPEPSTLLMLLTGLVVLIGGLSWTRNS